MDRLESWPSLKRAVRLGIPAGLAALASARRVPGALRVGAGGLLGGYWAAIYALYRKGGRAQTAHERSLFATATAEVVQRHYDLRVPTLEEELADWGRYHGHRHAMRYALVAREASDHLRKDGVVVDVGCGAALVADRLAAVPGRYIGVDIGDHHTRQAAERLANRPPGALHTSIGRSSAEALALRDSSADVVVMTEVIEHLLEPAGAVWEVARVLRLGGVLVLTTNNAAEAPLRSPLSHLGAWLEKALGASRPGWISLRPWVWPEPVDPTIVPGEGDRPVYVPHTHHIPGELRGLLAQAGLEALWWWTFEFPPPQSAMATRLARLGSTGIRLADLIESVARRTPGVRRLGTHLFVVARKVRAPSGAPPRFATWAEGPSPRIHCRADRTVYP